MCVVLETGFIFHEVNSQVSLIVFVLLWVSPTLFPLCRLQLLVVEMTKEECQRG